MIFRRLLQCAFVCLAICFPAAAQQPAPGSNFLFHLPVPGSNGTRVIGYLANTNDLNADLDTTGPANPTQILPTPDGSRVYLVANGALQVFSTGLQTLQGVNGIIGPVRSAAMTPDGKYLLVAGTQLYIVSTATNGIAATGLGTSDIVDVAVSPDSKTAWALQASPFFNSITPINLTNLSAGAKVPVQRAGETITYSPQGKLYLPSRNNISEYDAATLTLVRDTVMQALPGRMHFNLEGTKAYFIDKAEIQGFAIVSFNPATQATAGWPTNIFTTYRPTFDELYVAGPGRLFGLERSKSTLWEITDSPLSAAPASMPAFESSIVFAAAVSTEIPASQYLYVLTENSARPTLVRVSLANGSLDTFANALVSNGALRYIGIPAQAGASQILKFNDAQTLNEGGAAKTFFAYVTDPLGRPVYNQQVSFTADSASSAATIANASVSTNADGFVQANVTVPNVPGTYTITLTAGGASGAFTITVPTIGGGGGGGGDNGPRMTIAKGDGQLLLEGTDTFSNIDSQPLTVKVVDQNGKPQAGVPVSFTLLEGFGAVFPNSATTNEQGLAQTDFAAFGMPSGYAFFPNIIRAASDVGSAEFTLIGFHKSAVDAQGIPMEMDILTHHQVPVRRGDVMPRLFAVRIHSTRFPQSGEPIAGFGIRAGGGDVDFAGDRKKEDSQAGYCVNDTKSDTTGVAVCDFKVSCSLTSPAQVRFAVGELFFQAVTLLPTPGSGRMLSYVSGNEQSANVGQPVADRLIARLTDNCGDPVTNQAVTWTVTQGPATLTNVLSTSNNNGEVSARLTMGQAAGPIKVTVAIEGADPVVFTLNSTVTVSGITLTSGGGQSVLPGEAFPSPIVFTLRTNAGTPVGANINVNFALTGSGILGNASATTNASGQVQTTLTAGSNPGPLTVTATYSNLSASASLTVRSPTLPLTPASFSNAASGATGLVPCGLATVVGNGLAPNPVFLSGIGFGPLPYTLGTIDSLLVNNVPAPIQAVSNQNGKQQVNFQVPCETAVGNATVTIRVNGVVTTITGVPVLQGQPGIFTYAGPNGKVYGAVLRVKDGSYITPSNLAPTGENFYMILTGLGLVTPSTTTNSAGNDQAVNLTAVAGVNNGGVPTQTARYLRGQIGVYYVEFTIPKTSTAAPGTVLLTDTPLALLVNVNGQSVFSQPGVLLPGVVQGQ